MVDKQASKARPRPSTRRKSPARGVRSPKPGTTNKSRRDKDSYPEKTRSKIGRTNEILGILTLACALLVGPSLLSVHLGSGELIGPFGHLVGHFLHVSLGLVGYALVGWLLSFSLRIFACVVDRTQGKSREEAAHIAPKPLLWRKRIGLVMAIWFSAIILHLATAPRRLSGASLGGIVGEFSAELLRAIFSDPGAWVIGICGLALSLVLATEFSWVALMVRVLRSTVVAIDETREAFARAPERFRRFVRWMAHEFNDARQRREMVAVGPGPAELGSDERIPSPIVRVDLGDQKASSDAARKGYLGTERKPPEAPPASSPQHRARIDEPPAITIVTSDYDARPESDAKPRDSDGTPGPRANKRFATSSVKKVKEGLGFWKRKGADYEPPPIDLLIAHPSTGASVDKEAIKAQAARLTQTLADYKIIGTVTEVHPGPVVTMYEFVPEPGTRVSKVASLSNDLAMSLLAERVRIVAPIPGKGAIGIEVPNGSRETVSFKDIVADRAFGERKTATSLRLALGKNIFGAPIVVDLAKMPHLLVAGATGAGKSVCVNAMLCSLLMRHPPEEVKLILIDPKFLELSGYNDIPHLLLPVVTDPKSASVALRWAVAEMDRRYQLLADLRVRDISSYNRKVTKKRAAAEEEANNRATGAQNAAISEAQPRVIVRTTLGDSEEEISSTETVAGDLNSDDLGSGSRGEESERPADTTDGSSAGSASKGSPGAELADPLPYLVVVIDEFADLMMVAAKEVETSVARLAQKARACGIHLIVATQRPSVDVITGLIKANFPSRIAFQVASNHDSKTILGSYGAENLLGAGDMLLLDRGTEMKRVHGAYISDEEIESVITWLQKQGKPTYDMDILRAAEDSDSADDPSSEPRDELYDQAVNLVAESGQASISLVQRRLRIGYNRAARLVEEMERQGIVGPPDGARGREVLVQHHG